MPLKGSEEASKRCPPSSGSLRSVAEAPASEERHLAISGIPFVVEDHVANRAGTAE